MPGAIFLSLPFFSSLPLSTGCQYRAADHPAWRQRSVSLASFCCFLCVYGPLQRPGLSRVEGVPKSSFARSEKTLCTVPQPDCAAIAACWTEESLAACCAPLLSQRPLSVHYSLTPRPLSPLSFASRSLPPTYRAAGFLGSDGWMPGDYGALESSWTLDGDLHTYITRFDRNRLVCTFLSPTALAGAIVVLLFSFESVSVSMSICVSVSVFLYLCVCICASVRPCVWYVCMCEGERESERGCVWERRWHRETETERENVCTCVRDTNLSSSEWSCQNTAT